MPTSDLPEKSKKQLHAIIATGSIHKIDYLTVKSQYNDNENKFIFSNQTSQYNVRWNYQLPCSIASSMVVSNISIVEG